MLNHRQLGRNVVELLADFLADDVPHLPAARAGLLIFRQIVDDPLARQIRGQASSPVAVGRRSWCGFGWRFRRECGRGQLIQDRFEEYQLLGIDLLRRATEPSAEHLLQLVLQAVDLAILLLQLFEDLRSLGAKKLDLLSKLREFRIGNDATLPGHALGYARRRRMVRKVLGRAGFFSRRDGEAIATLDTRQLNA